MQGDQLIYIDGQFYSKSDAKVSVYDHGLLYGDGVFEGIRIYNDRVLRLKDHIDRLYDSAKAIYLNIPATKEEMTEIVRESCRKNGLNNGYIRLIVTRGVGDLGLDPRKSPKPSIICIAASIVLYPEECYQKGMAIITATQRRNKATIVDPQIKSLNYLNNIFAKVEAGRCGVGEALMLNEDGIVAECTGDNIFVIKNNVIYTPPRHVGILCGITRQIIIELARASNIDVREEEFTLFNVYSADECFLTGTAAEAIPVIQVDGRIIGTGSPGPITAVLLAKYREYVQNEGSSIYKSC